MITYKKAGVDIDKANKFVEAIKPIIKKTRGDIGGFGGSYKLNLRNIKSPVLVSSTDGVGTKLKIAFLAKKHDTVGIDLVAMNVNDILCTGARPLFFLDYIATGAIDTDVLKDVVKGISAGCLQAGCALIGGETAEMPSFYKKGEYDLAGFSTGIVDEKKFIDGKDIKIGDVVIGLSSSGLHSNGYSLARKVFSDKELKKYSDKLLAPTKIYVKSVLRVLDIFNSKSKIVKGIAHITGGAFYDKLPRVLPKGTAVAIDKTSWEIPEIFKIIQKAGNVPEKDMFRTFNMGIGMAIVISPEKIKEISSVLNDLGEKSFVIGKIVKGKRSLII